MARKTRTTYECPGEHDVVKRGQPRAIIVEIDGDQMFFRHKGARTRFQISIPDAMREAVIRNGRP